VKTRTLFIEKMEIIIKKASLKDASDILHVQMAAFESEGKLYNDFTISPLVETIEQVVKDFDTHIILKSVLNNGQLVGSVRGVMQGDICWLSRLSVLPEYQKKGIGTNLMLEIEKCFPKACRYELAAGSKSYGNINLYKKLGYEPLEEIKKNNVILLRMGKTSKKEIKNGF